MAAEVAAEAKKRRRKPTVTVADVVVQLHQLPASKLASVLDYVSYLADQETHKAFNGLLASREVLAQEWDSPEDDEAFGSYE